MVYLKAVGLVFLGTVIFFSAASVGVLLAPLLSILIALGLVITVIKMWDEPKENKENQDKIEY